jgi:hypothetical protein
MPLDDLLTPLTKLTALYVDFHAADDTAPPLPASLARLTALRDLDLWGFGQPSPHQLHSLLAPLTQLTALSLPMIVDGTWRLPDLPSLQLLRVEQVAEGGLALLAASCPALVDLRAYGSVAIGATDAAARLPALTDLTCWEDFTVAPSARAQFSLAACAPALKSLDGCLQLRAHGGAHTCDGPADGPV